MGKGVVLICVTKKKAPTSTRRGHFGPLKSHQNLDLAFWHAKQIRRFHTPIRQPAVGTAAGKYRQPAVLENREFYFPQPPQPPQPGFGTCFFFWGEGATCRLPGARAGRRRAPRRILGGRIPRACGTAAACYNLLQLPEVLDCTLCHSNSMVVVGSKFAFDLPYSIRCNGNGMGDRKHIKPKGWVPLPIFQI